MQSIDGSCKIHGTLVSWRFTPVGVRVEPTISSLTVSAQWGDRSAAEALFATLYSQLHRMAKRIDPGLSEIMDLKFFSDFTFAEIAGILDLSQRTPAELEKGAHLASPQYFRTPLVMRKRCPR